MSGNLVITAEYLQDLNSRLATLYQALSAAYDGTGRASGAVDASAIGDAALASACGDYLAACRGALQICAQLTQAMEKVTADTSATMAQIDDRLTQNFGSNGPVVEMPANGPAEELLGTIFDNAFPPGTHHGSFKKSGGGYVGGHRRGSFHFGRRL